MSPPWWEAVKCDCRLHLFAEQRWGARVGALEGSPPGDPVVLLGDVSAHMDNDSETWRGVVRRNGLLDLNLSGVELLVFCGNHSVSITNTVSEPKGVL